MDLAQLTAADLVKEVADRAVFLAEQKDRRDIARDRAHQAQQFYEEALASYKNARDVLDKRLTCP